MTTVNNSQEALKTGSLDLTTEDAAEQERIIQELDLQPQLDLEAQMVRESIQAFRDDLAKHQADGTLENTAPGMRVLSVATASVQDRMAKKMPGSSVTGYRLLREYSDSLDLAAALGVHAAINMTMDKGQPRKYATAAEKLGHAFHKEVQINKLTDEFPKEMKQLKSQIARSGTSNQRALSAKYAAKARHLEKPLITISEGEAIAIGSVILECVIEDGLLSIVTLPSTEPKKSGATALVQSQQLLDAIDNLADRAAHYDIRYLPMVREPIPWNAQLQGGYYTKGVHTPKLVIKTGKDQMKRLYEGDLDNVLGAVNAIQSTPWAVNTKVLEIVEGLIEKGDGLAGLAHTDAKPMPPKPANFDAIYAENPDDDRVKGWMVKAKLTHEYNAKIKSKRRADLALLRLAQRFKDEPRIYFPHVLDFRGRIYSLPSTLSPQGSDRSKALLKFAEGERIGEVGAYSLAVQGANVYGYDKEALDARVEWVQANTPMILEIANDPMGTLSQWVEVDEPWQFLAFCFEWAGYQDQGADFVSTLPVAMDGSCNGLQHYSAALRDAEGGAEVNLVPRDKPADIYGKVAGRLTDLVNGVDTPPLDSFPVDPATGLPGPFDNEQAPIFCAAKLKQLNLGRKLTKRTVMTTPYGVGGYGARAQVQDALEEMIDESLAPNPFVHLHQWPDGQEPKENTGLQAAAMFLTPLLMQAIQENLQGAKEGQAFIQEAAKLALDAGHQVGWTTPDGFPVEQHYLVNESGRIRVNIHGNSVSQIRFNKATDKIDKAKSKTAAPPNFVHSLDAAAMRMYVNKAKAEGIKHFAMVHDSYGTLASRAADMNRLLREAFVELYRDNDVLANFRAEQEAKSGKTGPETPAMGTLDIEQVMESDYFFA